MTKCDKCDRKAVVETMTMDLDFSIKSLYLCNPCVKVMSKGMCVIDGRDEKNIKVKSPKE